MESRTVFKYNFELPYVNTFFSHFISTDCANWRFLVSMPVRTQSKQSVQISSSLEKGFMTLFIPQLRLEDTA